MGQIGKPTSRCHTVRTHAQMVFFVAAYCTNVCNACLLENFLAARRERAGKAAQSANLEETRRV